MPEAEAPGRSQENINKVTNVQMMIVSRCIGGDWRALCRMLPGKVIPEHKFDQLLEEHRSEGLCEVAYRALDFWRETRPQEATLQNLCKTLTELNYTSVAELLENKF
ncbi:uncharacterized protein LOC143232321 [Tachypleus tridentatus]|uniref:uncharacterized protein LOC143232321 n=1 Tax=Tachypleus tridentatus TaxID=6853 RepID=UPI003FD56F0C